MQSDWEPRPLDPDEALYDFTKGVARGTSLLEGTCAADTPVTVYEYMMRPIMECMDICLRAKGQGGKGLHPGKVNTVVHKEDGYALSIFKSPKVGKKAARAVPLVTNCHHGPHVWRKRRYRLPGIVANYRTFAPGVDVCNQLCLQHREERRFPNWWKALNGMLLRMASTNAFTSCKALKLCAPGETMHNWQWRLMRYIFPARTIEVQAKHLPIRAKRGTCVCCRGGTSVYKCQACGVSLHVDCFAKYHQ